MMVTMMKWWWWSHIAVHDDDEDDEHNDDIKNIRMIRSFRVTCKDSPEKLTFGRQSAKRQGFTLVLLSDWLIVCKRKG